MAYARRHLKTLPVLQGSVAYPGRGLFFRYAGKLIAVGTFAVEFADIQLKGDIAKIEKPLKLKTFNGGFTTLLFKTAR